MSKKLTFALSLAMAVLPLTAHALGLGEIKLNSALNDKFNADIQIVGATSDELDSLDVKLADLAKFSQAGLDHPVVLDQLQFVVVRNPDGTAYVHITSTQPVREPFLDFLIDANWNNGELIREYTVLLNPPTFQSANAAKPAPAPAPAPAAASAPAPVAAAPVPAPSVTAPTQATAPAAVAVAPQAPPVSASAAAPEAAASPPQAPAPSLQQAPAQRALGTNYGPIHRGETLSGIAKSVRPEGVTLNQMMIAIYQANPEVFMHNINRMKAGYILRMPTASDVQAVSVADANSEVREQMAAWRNKTPSETPPPPASTAAAAPSTPALQLVAPSSAASSSAPVPGAEKEGTGETATGGKPGSKSAAAPPAPPSPSQAPISVNSNSMAAVQQQAAQQNAAPTPNPAVLPPPAATNVPLPKPAAPKPKPAAQPAPAESGGIMDMLFSIYSLFALIAIAVIVLLVVMIKKRKGAKSSGMATPGRIKGANWLKEEQAGGGADTTEGSSTTRTKAGKAKKSIPVEDQEKTVLTEAPTEMAGGGDGDKTMLMAAPAIPTGDTMVGGAPSGGAAKLDVSDPMAEADFHMAYGLYDQAADTLKKALRQEPGRRELQLKLLEVFFTAGDKANFIGEAKKLRAGMGDTPDKDWESVAIMGRQVAPEEAMFSTAGASAGGAVDIALDGGGTDTVVSDMDALAGAFTSEPPPAPPTVAAPAPALDNALEFSIPDLEPEAPAPAPAPAPAAPADGGMEFNLGDLNFEPAPAAPKAEEKKKAPVMGTDEPTVATDFGTDSQVEFDKALNDLASFVNTNVPPQPAEAPEEGHDKTLAIRPPKPAEAAPEPVAAEPAAGGASISEIGTKLDLARAYIDMGDPDGAKSILEEVVAEGNAQQKQEAQELMKHVS